MRLILFFFSFLLGVHVTFNEKGDADKGKKMKEEKTPETQEKERWKFFKGGRYGT